MYGGVWNEMEYALYKLLSTFIMKWITRMFLKMMITKAKNDQYDEKSERVKLGYDAEIKCYKEAIEFLKS